MDIYAGNLAYQVTEQILMDLFAPYGAIESVKIVKDRVTGRSKGFGFVIMPNEQEGQHAISGLHGKEVAGRPLNLSVARPRQ